jgi:hypothetical protein
LPFFPGIRGRDIHLIRLVIHRCNQLCGMYFTSYSQCEPWMNDIPTPMRLRSVSRSTSRKLVSSSVMPPVVGAVTQPAGSLSELPPVPLKGVFAESEM